MDEQRDGGSEILELAVDQQSRFRLSGEETEQATGFVTLDSRHTCLGGGFCFGGGRSALTSTMRTQLPQSHGLGVRINTLPLGGRLHASLAASKVLLLNHK
ncbi:hypothetical protein NQZ68_010650 [Dissostichus eleginoides]|nr:hypothetical protein NQZ68_010650 [Dissostichus eleginoides]